MISPPPALEMFALNDPFSYNSPTTELAFQRLFGLCANANCNHDGSYEGLLYRDAVRKRSYHDSLNKRRTTRYNFQIHDAVVKVDQQSMALPGPIASLLHLIYNIICHRLWNNDLFLFIRKRHRKKFCTAVVNKV